MNHPITKASAAVAAPRPETSRTGAVETTPASGGLPAARGTMIKGIRMNYYEWGEGDPVLFLHGIPSNAWMWRHVAPLVAESGGRRCIALDLAGFGSSDLPADGDYGIRSQYEHLELVIETLGLDRLTLVVNDLGSLLGLKYAVEHPDRIRGLVLIEAAFMPAEAWYGQLTIMQKMMFAMFRNQRRAEAWIVEKNMIPAMMMKMGVVRRLSPSELAPYLAPYATDIERRRVMLSGPGPATFPPRGKTRAEGDFAFELDAVARGLVTLNRKVPFLLVEASPGMITRAKAIGYARKHFPDLTRISVGRGRHFLAEDHPEKIGKGISEWLSSKRI